MDQLDKTSITYFMTEMTQEEFDELRKFRSSSNKDYETGLSRDERYIFNKIRYDHIQKLEDETSRLQNNTD